MQQITIRGIEPDEKRSRNMKRFWVLACAFFFNATLAVFHFTDVALRNSGYLGQLFLSDAFAGSTDHATKPNHLKFVICYNHLIT